MVLLGEKHHLRDSLLFLEIHKYYLLTEVTYVSTLNQYQYKLGQCIS